MWLDDAIAWVAPAAGLRRARARAALQLVRSYEGSSVGRRTSGWFASSSSANAEISSAIPRLRNRSRDLVRNNPYARRAIATLVGNAVGTGITLGITNGDQAAKVWALWGRECDFYGDHDISGLQSLVCRGGFESGDCLVVRVRVSASKAGKSGVPLKIKVLEGDFLDTNKHGPQSNGNYCIAGVELDMEGRRVAFWIYLVHPGETSIYTRQPSVRVLAEDVIYHFEKERPGQVLGVPRLAASIMRLRDLDEYQEALLVKKKIEACFAAFVTTSDDNRALGTATSTDTQSDGSTRRVEKLSPGTIIYGRDGEEVTFGNPSAGPEVGFVADELRAIAMGAGCTYEQLTGDLSNANYSSLRAGREEFKTLIEQYRWLTFIPQVCERIYAWFEEAAELAGRIRTTDYEHVWTPPRWAYVNPKEDVETTLLELRGGITSHPEVVRERGYNFDEKVKEIAAGRKTLKDAGVEVDYSISGKATSPADTVGDTTVDGGAAADNKSTK